MPSTNDRTKIVASSLALALALLLVGARLPFCLCSADGASPGHDHAHHDSHHHSHHHSHTGGAGRARHHDAARHDAVERVAVAAGRSGVPGASIRGHDDCECLRLAIDLANPIETQVGGRHGEDAAPAAFVVPRSGSFPPARRGGSRRNAHGPPGRGPRRSVFLLHCAYLI